ncbi:hypothetical protein M011DRAFT_166226 [Sporormia fimetaria CBS 119925]|uniref:Uncharacterized protein n=1 Tax=Sporormia fimetaria CBS 119925 TaxID=1340428 RepID=A0A6A6V4L5_9PLEO|nr:hypothetical protein M011DRAFT_166226 [Sporormia fimetaria CBS 119925]
MSVRLVLAVEFSMRWLSSFVSHAHTCQQPRVREPGGVTSVVGRSKVETPEQIPETLVPNSYCVHKGYLALGASIAQCMAGRTGYAGSGRRHRGIVIFEAECRALSSTRGDVGVSSGFGRGVGIVLRVVGGCCSRDGRCPSLTESLCPGVEVDLPLPRLPWLWFG